MILVTLAYILIGVVTRKTEGHLDFPHIKFPYYTLMNKKHEMPKEIITCMCVCVCFTRGHNFKQIVACK